MSEPPPSSRLRLLFVATALIGAGVLIGWFWPQRQALAGLLPLLGTLLLAAPILWDTLLAIRARGFAATQFYMDQYVLLALAACLATGRYVTGGVVALVLVFGQLLEERTVVGVELALSRLRGLSKIRALRLRRAPVAAVAGEAEAESTALPTDFAAGTQAEAGVEGETRFESEAEVDSSELIPGDLIRIRPGDAIPADAVVIAGRAQVDQSGITGESLPVEVGPEQEIFAGTRNLDGLLTARVTGSGEQTILGRVQQIIEEAKDSEAPIMRLSEDYARYYTPLILLIGASVFLLTRDVERAIAVLIVAIPCAFVLASPSAMVSAIAAGSRLGLLIKSSRHLEAARLTDTVVFDKTGTLTQGRLAVVDIQCHPAAPDASAAPSPAELLSWAASLEKHSRHPLAEAICEHAHGQAAAILEVADWQEVAGRGVSGRVGARQIHLGRRRWLEEQGWALQGDAQSPHSLVSLVCDGHHAGDFHLADTVRPEAAEALARLRALGIGQFVMLTGDRQSVAAALAVQLGLTDFRAECLPEDKLQIIRELRAQGRRVLVVGDGLNDAPALAEGDLGVAMGSLGNEVAIHTADVALMSNDLRRLADLLALSAKTVGIINQNLLCGFLFIILAIVLSALGLVNPIMAAFFHEFSAFFVIFNSARLLRFDGWESTQLFPQREPENHAEPALNAPLAVS